MGLAVLEYLEINHTKISKINKVIDSCVEDLTYRKDIIYNQIVRKDIINFDSDVESLILLDDIKYLIDKLLAYDFDFYLVDKIFKKINSLGDSDLREELDLLAGDLEYYNERMKELIDDEGWRRR